MRGKYEPAVDPRIAPEQGVTRSGQPLSYNRAPASDLSPWIGRIYVTKVAAPADYTLRCSLLNDVACLRIQLAGDWTAESADGFEHFGHASLFFGPQTQRMPVSVTGSFISVGLAIRPGACTVLQGLKIGQFVDRMVLTDTIGLPSEMVLGLLNPEGSPEDWSRTLEALVRQRVEACGGIEPDPICRTFEDISFRDPTVTVSEAAAMCGVERRRLERIVARDFGMSPKQVLRRARALDMASHLRGVADREEADEIALRFYDESHLIHEFTKLFGMSPRQFVETPQPILTLSLESRQARRLEALNRIAPGESRPWQ